MKTSLYISIAASLCSLIIQDRSLETEGFSVRQIARSLAVFRCCVKYCKNDESASHCQPEPIERANVSL